MKKRIHRVNFLITATVIQLLILGVCSYIFSSKINLIPWYTPLSSYLLLYFIILFVAQIIILFYVWFMRERYPVYKVLLVVSAINSMILLFMFLISLLSILLFYVFSVFFALIEIALFIYLLISGMNLLKG